MPPDCTVTVALAVALIGIALWAWHRAQSDARFNVKHIEVAGAVHTTRADIDRATAMFIGANLFRTDIARVQAEVRALPWVSRVEIE